MSLAEHPQAVVVSPSAFGTVPHRLLDLRYSSVGRKVVYHLPLLAVLVVQAILTLRLSNTAFQDEALYLYAGHREILQFQHGTSTYDNYNSYFSGAPWLYPVIGAAINEVAGLAGARALSLALMLGATALVAATTRRLFDRHAALLAAAVFAVAGSTLFMGRLATYDALAVFLLALSAWIVVVAARRHPATVLLAAPVVVLAVACKYASLLYLPTILAMSLLCALRRPPGRSWARWTASLARPVILLLATVGLALVVLRLAGTAFLSGLVHTTTARATGTDEITDVLLQSAQYVAGPLAICIAGSIRYGRDSSVSAFARWRRKSLGAVWTLTLVIAPLYQAHLHTLTSLHKHVGFGLIFAAPMTGYALAALLGRGTRSPQRLGAVLGICTLLAAAGLSQSQRRFEDWPTSTPLTQVLRTQVRPVTGHYLVEESEVPRYYLQDITEPFEWSGTYVFDYTDHQGRQLTGPDAYKAAIADRYFDIIALRYGPTAALDGQIDARLRAHDGYEEIASVPADSGYGPGTFTVWRAVR